MYFYNEGEEPIVETPVVEPEVTPETPEEEV